MIMVVNHKATICCKEKVNIAKQNKKITPHTKTQEAQNAAVIPMHSKHTNHHGSYTFIYWKWHR